MGVSACGSPATRRPHAQASSRAMGASPRGGLVAPVVGPAACVGAGPALQTRAARALAVGWRDLLSAPKAALAVPHQRQPSPCERSQYAVQMQRGGR